MRMGIPTEIQPGETRVAATPETVKKLAAGTLHTIIVQAGAGAGASITDRDFQTAGATIAGSAADVYAQAELLLKVRGPDACEIAMLRPGTIVIGLLSPHDPSGLTALAQQGATGFALERLPRITRAQTMDVLSSQANIAGYKAAIIAADEYGRFMPLLMTAAGTVKAARVLVLGAGVAGLQAIATARRLGAVVEAIDVRPAVKEEVQSLGATFVQLDLTDATNVGAGGYAKELSADHVQRERELIHQHVKTSDVVITTAMVPGRKAPVLITEALVRDMRRGAAIVD